ncbi:PepSY domain-containing protein [Kocuria marina]|uniref:PepSY domain-containing protein n=1 Tax=Kocuria marina TaxID=223184 RepID=UPI0021B6735B|nr:MULTISPECIES: PepSY domain-containing protein [Kocuria]MCT2021876.1 PepSY domain-containing protein [Kocuria marina]
MAHGHQAHTGPSSPGSFDAVLTSTRTAGLGSQLVEIRPAKSRDAAWTVAENDRSWPTQLDSVAVDPASMQVTGHVRFSERGLPAKLTQWAIAAHMGLLFGLPNQIALAVLAVSLVGLVVGGYVMWWRRRPTRTAGAGFGPVPPRGAPRSAPPWAWPLLLVVGLGAGLFVPLLGISLVAFLAADLAVAVVARRRSARESAH